MVFSDLELYLGDKWLNFTIKADNIDGFFEGDFVNIVSDGVAYIKKVDDEERFTTGKFISAKQQLEFENNSLGKYYCQIDSIIDNQMSINMAFDLSVNYASETDSDGIKIAVLDNAVSRKSVDELNRVLKSNYKLNIAGRNYYVIGLYQGNQENKNTFILIDARNGKYFSVTEKTIYELNQDLEAASELSYCIDKDESSLRNADRYSIWLYDGEINFNDSTSAKKCSIQMKSFIEKKGDEYIRKWRAYAEAEYKKEKERSAASGILSYERYEVEDKENSLFKLYLENLDYLVPFVTNSAKDDEGNIPVRIWSGLRSVPAKLLVDEISKRDKTVVVRMNENSTPFRHGGIIEIDLAGSKMMYDRRMLAFDRIEGKNGKKAANECVAALLEGKKFNLYQSKKLNHKFKVDEEILRRYFTKDGVYYPPNESQYRAIEIALNTPDFAIIQGPPGTGKTKVIDAIYAHMQKYSKNAEISKGEILLSAYQRDATANLTREYDGRFGLPIIAYYGSKGDDMDESIKTWRNGICEKFIEKHGEITMASVIKDTVYSIKSLKNSFEKKCSLHRMNDILEQIIIISKKFYDQIEETKKLENVIIEKIESDTEENLLTKAIKILESKKRRVLSPLLNKKTYGDKSQWRSFVKSLPTSKREFSDNGRQVIEKIIKYLQRLSVSDIEKDIEALSEIISRNEFTKEDFNALKEIKINLIFELNREDHISESEKTHFVSLIDDIIDAMKEYRVNYRQGLLSEYYEALNSDVEIMRTVPEYQEIIAATHQKSLIMEGKNKVHNFKEVLIDEAARSCPADLMITLSCAENRMILVGDHNQLPQFVGDEVLRKLVTEKSENELYDTFTKNSDADAIKEMYQNSMFQYMLDKVKKLEEQDGHPRFVQLNEQYRMAPKIGDIVAENFYTKDGKRTLFNGINKDEAYTQNFSGIAGKNLIWVNMPNSFGDERRTETRSRFRSCESSVIADYVVKMIDELGPEKKIGIITFYRGQTQKIKNDLKKKLNKSYEELKEQVEIGTVDAFQGKEFEVVFLSLVITNKENEIGFLESRNRMCVALSRAKKCLVVVGNDHILNYKYSVQRKGKWEEHDASVELKCLVDILNYCKEEVGGVCEYRTEKPVGKL